MRIEQRAGEVAIVVYTGGWPHQAELTFRLGSEIVQGRLSINDLYDMRYCIDRVLDNPKLVEGKE